MRFTLRRYAPPVSWTAIAPIRFAGAALCLVGLVTLGLGGGIAAASEPRQLIAAIETSAQAQTQTSGAVTISVVIAPAPGSALPRTGFDQWGLIWFGGGALLTGIALVTLATVLRRRFAQLGPVPAHA